MFNAEKMRPFQRKVKEQILIRNNKKNSLEGNYMFGIEKFAPSNFNMTYGKDSMFVFYSPKRYNLLIRTKRNQYSRSFCTQANVTSQLRELAAHLRKCQGTFVQTNSPSKSMQKEQRKKNSLAKSYKSSSVIFNKRNETFYAKKKKPTESAFELKGTRMTVTGKEIFSTEAIRHYITPIKKQNHAIRTLKTSGESRKFPIIINEEFKVIYNPPKVNISSTTVQMEHIHFMYREVRGRIVILQFDGVLGDFVLTPSGEYFCLRPNANQLLKYLNNKVHIVILFKCIKARAEFALSQLAKQGAKIDGGYIVNKNNTLPINYEQIYNDFKIANEELTNKVIILGSYDIEEFTLKDNTIKFHEAFNSVPIILRSNIYTQIPIIILVKNSKLWNKELINSLFVVESILTKLISANWDMSLDTIKTTAIQSKYVEEYRKIKSVIERRVRRHKKLENDRVKVRIDMSSNAKYMELIRCNEDIKMNIRQYCNSVKIQNIKNELDEVKECIVEHRLIIIRNNITRPKTSGNHSEFHHRITKLY